QRNEAQAKEERDKATRNFKLAQGTADGLVFNIAQGLRDVRGMRAASVRKILETAKSTFEQLAASAPDDLGIQRSRGAMLSEFGDTYLALGDLASARTAYEEMHVIAGALVKVDPGNVQWQHDLSVSFGKNGDVRRAAGQSSEALAAYRKGLAIAQQF